MFVQPDLPTNVEEYESDTTGGVATADALIEQNTRWLLMFEPVGQFSAQMVCRLWQKNYLPKHLTIVAPAGPRLY